MNHDFISNSNCYKAIEVYRNTKFITHGDIEYQKMFLSLPKATQLEILHTILEVQGKVILENIKVCKDTHLSGFGTFKYREGKRRIAVIRDELANEFGFDTYNDINIDAVKAKIDEKISLIKRTILISEPINLKKLGKSYNKAVVYSLDKKFI